VDWLGNARGPLGTGVRHALGKGAHPMNSPGGIVEVDLHKLDRDLLILLGSKNCLEKYIGMFEAFSQQAAPGPAHLLREAAQMMRDEHEQITVEFAARAIRAKAATMTEFKNKN
jgi:hypothetical protein